MEILRFYTIKSIIGNTDSPIGHIGNVRQRQRSMKLKLADGLFLKFDVNYLLPGTVQPQQLHLLHRSLVYNMKFNLNTNKYR